VKVKTSLTQTVAQAIAFLALAWVLYGSCTEFYQIAWGTGNSIGEFSLKWGVAFYGYVALCILLSIAVCVGLWQRRGYAPLAARFASIRNRLSVWRWSLMAAILVFPVWLLQYTPWGTVIDSPYLRLLIWLVDILFVAVLLDQDGAALLSWNSLLAGVLLTGASFALTVPFGSVTSHPFALGWSEGNRLYDYSIMFGRERYIFPADRRLSPYLDIGRQLIGGLPFLLPNLSIAAERFWAALIYVAPDLIVGWLAFRTKSGSRILWLLSGLWAYMFLAQGPIHPPLAVSAALTALAWGQPFWLAGILIFGAAYLTQLSRFSWVFAVPLWIGMLELSGALLQGGRLPRRAWIRSLALGALGLLGGVLLPKIIGLFQGRASAGLSVSGVSTALTKQPLLWYRLLPNATYGMGIIWGLLVAVLALVLLLLAFWRTGRWQLNNWQKAAILLPLSAFLGVGLVASTKIGGGGDLHNVDMFLVGLVFTAAIAWRNGGREWLLEGAHPSLWKPVLLVALLALPARSSLMALYPLNVSDKLAWVSTLSDTERVQALGSLPSASETSKALKLVQQKVAEAANRGPVLFMDQRQLLTFGYLQAPLVAEYDKKVLIDKAMASDSAYFSTFYADLAARRFSLIVTNPLRASIQDSSDEFGEENNAWVEWVSNPVLCYYEPIETLRSVQVQLLVPRAGQPDCSAELPQEK
jgi:hypothetical protein